MVFSIILTAIARAKTINLHVENASQIDTQHKWLSISERKRERGYHFELNVIYWCNGLTMDTVAVDPTEFQNIDVLEHFHKRKKKQQNISSNRLG